MTKTIYLAGGCFWGTEHLAKNIRGVVKCTVGYANGKGKEYADYKTVCRGETGFRETVRVEWDPDEVSLDHILFTFFRSIRPEQRNRQGNDIGTQYQSGIYWTDDESKDTAIRIAEIERRRHKHFFTELKPLENFFDAEEYHQDYLDKNPSGYCHIPFSLMKDLTETTIDAGKYIRPDDEKIKEKLTSEEYRVTQEGATERPYTNEYWESEEKGIYVDVVTGEPLFTSKDKYRSSCGWPSFTRPVEAGVVVENEDLSHGMVRTEVRSRAGNSHLGHVFEGDPESPNGVRYCINSAALSFIPLEEMEEKGYGQFVPLLEGAE